MLGEFTSDGVEIYDDNNVVFEFWQAGGAAETAEAGVCNTAGSQLRQ